MFFSFPFFLSLSYWFDRTPESMEFVTLRLFFFLFLFLFLLGIVLRIQAKHRAKDRSQKKLFRSFSSVCFTASLLGFILLFFRYEETPFFGARFWFLLWVLMIILWVGFLLRYFFRIVPEKQKRLFEQRQREKYLPKAK